MMYFYKYLINQEYNLSISKERLNVKVKSECILEKKRVPLINDMEISYLAAFFLACKINNTLISLNFISKVFYQKIYSEKKSRLEEKYKLNLNKNTSVTTLTTFEETQKIAEEEDFQESLKLNMKKEDIILSIERLVKEKEIEIIYFIGLNLEFDSPYTYFLELKNYILKYLKNPVNSCQIVVNFINDSFKLPVCLYYEPLKIALASLYLLHYYFKIDLPDLNGVKWYKLLDKSIDLNEIKDLAMTIFTIYQGGKQPRDKKKIDENTFKVQFLFEDFLLSSVKSTQTDIIQKDMLNSEFEFSFLKKRNINN